MKLKLLVLFFVFTSLCSVAQNMCDNTKQKIVLFEKNLIREKQKMKKRFIGPPDEAFLFDSLLKRKMPDLALNAHKYADCLIQILKSESTINHNRQSLMLKLLYYNKIDLYASLLLDYCNIFIQSKGDAEVLLAMLNFTNSIVNSHYSNLVIRNYQNNKIVMAINLLFSKTQAVNRLMVVDKDFKIHAHQLLSGEMDKYLKDDNWIFVIQ